MILLPQNVTMVRAEATRLFVVLMGIMFLVLKLGIRRVTRRLAGLPFDTRDAIAWFGVDLSVLSLSIWIAADLPQAIGLSSKESTLVYMFLAAFVVGTSAAYKRYLRVSARMGAGFWDYVGVSLNIAVCLFLGFLELLGTAAAL
jgi:hypothetical protein